MKLIDLLVKELPNRGDWCENALVYAQDNNGKVYPYRYEDLYISNGKWRHESAASICGKSFKLENVADDYDSSLVTREQYEAAISKRVAEIVSKSKHPAHSFLEKGVQHMKDRAEKRDSEDGERSMKACVDAFNAMFGHNLTETQGWQFMVLLKMARSRNKFNPDDYEDGAAYTGLAGEAHSHEQK